MSVYIPNTAVGTTPVLVPGPSDKIRIISASRDIWIGGSGVVVGSGLQVGAGRSHSLAPGIWYVVCNTTTEVDVQYSFEGNIDDTLNQSIVLPERVRSVSLSTTDADLNASLLQSANDTWAAFGGGKVVIPPGVWPCLGLIQDSRVEFYGPGATLRHPDGDGTDIIKSRLYSTTGTISAASKTLTVASASGIEVGSVIGIRAGAGYSPIQFTSLVAGITDVQTADIELTLSTGFPSGGHMVVDSEVIAYTGIVANKLVGVTRGVYGTTAAAHSLGAFIGTASRLMTEVVAVSGTTITLDSASTLNLTNTPVQIGIMHPKITGLRFDGNRPVGGAAASTNPIHWSSVRFGTIRDIRSYRCEAALFLDQGTRDCVIDGLHADECSVPEAARGSVIWLFQHCHRNILNNIIITGDMWAGVYLDNRTTVATEWDGPCNGNKGTNWTFAVLARDPWITNTAVLIVASNHNVFSDITCTNVRTGFVIYHVDQVYTADASMPTAKSNHIDKFKIINGYQPYVLDSPGNLVTGLAYEQATTNGTNAGNNLIAFSAISPAGSPSLGRFTDGAQTTPGIAFTTEPNTGFYKIAAGQVQFVSQGTLVARFRSTDFLLADGKHLSLGVTTGSKIGSGATEKMGFWGATPVVRPSANADTSGATLGQLETEVNELKALLRSIGLMAP